jgi:hypothetical protein
VQPVQLSTTGPISFDPETKESSTVQAALATALIKRAV